eukprot:CAMPEP_0116029418 /NCGR_PEP_ID=MMETSP0321-20121206/16130_1 /TAXON_ID=163516 /ORGANISM="Leptocylindrus danicus var. danicus, Strain B650" /LENGTH=196 /DNA_ID=CAMNT_0003503795 /DNA_START=430 /DNA_END=1020 /DNA_ORIENTATION=+
MLYYFPNSNSNSNNSTVMTTQQCDDSNLVMMEKGSKHDKDHENEIAAPLLEGKQGMDIEIGYGNDDGDDYCNVDVFFVLGWSYGLAVFAVVNFCRTIVYLHQFSCLKGALIAVGSSMCMVACFMNCVLLNAQDATVKTLYPWMLAIHATAYITSLVVFMMSVGGDLSSLSYVEINSLLIPLACIVLLWRYKAYFLS